MGKKNYKTIRNKELDFWKKTMSGETYKAGPGRSIRYNKKGLIRKLGIIREVFSDTPIWRDLLKIVESEKPLSNRQMDVLNSTYFKVKFGEYMKYKKKKIPVIFSPPF